MATPLVEILLATWQGERFLAEQLASLERQRLPGTRIIARDDGSTDGTRGILAAWSRRLGAGLRLLEDGRGNLGPVGNFGALVAASTAPYLMFCDQDDVWDDDKVPLSLAAMLAAERRHGAETPLLVHTDLRLIDAEGRPIAPSLWRHQRLAASPRCTLASALAHNEGASGCAMIVNRALVSLATPFPAGIVMHDWYLLQLAIAFGRRVPIRRQTISYRLHAGNAIGVTRFGVAHAARVWRRIRREHVLEPSRRQAAALWQAHGAALRREDAATVRALLRLGALGKADRWRTLVKHGFSRGWLPRDLVVAALV